MSGSDSPRSHNISDILGLQQTSDQGSMDSGLASGSEESVVDSPAVSDVEMSPRHVPIGVKRDMMGDSVYLNVSQSCDGHYQSKYYR